MRSILSLLTIFFLVACSQKKDNIFDAPVRMINGFESKIVSGTLVNLAEKPIGISSMLLCDSVMLLKASDSDYPQQIYVFSLSDNSLQGRFVAKGRGDKELLIPILKGRFLSNESSVCIFDLSKCRSYSLDIEKSIKNHSTELVQMVKLPHRTIDYYPYKECHLAFIPEEDDYVCRVLDNGGNQVDQLSLFPGVSAIDYFDRLSSACAINQTKGRLIMAMCMLPQINIIDVENGEKCSVAVSKEYKNWQNIFKEDQADRNVYYTSITKSEKCFMTLYSGSDFDEWVKGTDHPHIHVFDWDGNPMFDISVPQRLKTIAFDDISNQLYGVECAHKQEIVGITI